MAYILDNKDKKILYELDFDARQSCSQIAKKLGMSTEVVNYRIKKLEEENIITHHQVIVDLSKLNILQFKICLSFQHLTKDQLNIAITELKKNKAVKWIVECMGPWDLVVSMECDSIQSIEEVKNGVISLFGNSINKKSLSILVEAETYNRDYLLKNISSIRRVRVIMKKSNPYKLDKTDLDVLKQLAENGRRSVVDIAKSTNTTPRIVSYSIKKMLKDKVILGFKIALNYEKLGIRFYKTFIYTENMKKDRVNMLLKYLAQNRNVIHNSKVLSNWDLESEFEAFSEEEIDGVIRDIKDKFSDIIKSIDIITISKEHKFVYF